MVRPGMALEELRAKLALPGRLRLLPLRSKVPEDGVFSAPVLGIIIMALQLGRYLVWLILSRHKS